MSKQKLVLKINPEYAIAMPRPPEERYQEIKEDVRKKGQQVPIIINKDYVILDGHTRYQICQELGVEPRYTTRVFPTPLEEKRWVYALNIKRRDLPDFLHIELSIKLNQIDQEITKKNSLSNLKQGKQFPIPTGLCKPVGRFNENIAKEALGKESKHDTVRKAIKIMREASQNDLEALRSGKKTINSVFKQLNMKEKNLKPQNLPTGVFDLIYIDPPWESVSGAVRGAPDVHYNTMSLDEIGKLKLPMFENCVVFLWTINSMTVQTVDLIRKWGLEYRSKIIWDKDIMGTGYWVRTQHEELWICTKGKVPVPDPKVVVRSVYREKRDSTHSKKPEYFYKIIEDYYPARQKLEMFARKKREGWQSWGNEIC